MSKQSIITKQKKEFLGQFLKHGKRLDGRTFMEYREIEAKPNVIPNAEGSAIVSIGSTQVIAGIKLEVVEPFPEEPNRGALITNAELLPLASAKFEPGPPDENSIEFSRVVDRAIRSSECIDMEKLFIEEGKVFGVFIDLYVIDYGGNLFDPALLAASFALKHCRLPKVEEGKIIRNEIAGKLPLKNPLPVSNTFSKLDDYLLLDPSYEEDIASDAQLIVSTTNNYVCSLQKRGTGSFKKSDVLNIIDLAFKHAKELNKYLID
ncbi:MAG: exosome complex protein Rrp42 [Candidatus Anstonellales archaeon]